MASGKKNYFRHSTTAFEDSKIQMAIELLGYEGYAYYFILIELLAKQCENEFKNPIQIHQQTLRIVWRKSQQSCNKVVRKLEQSGLFLVTFKESFYEFSIPNLSKYLGKYESKLSPNAPNKRKEKERKEKETKTKLKVVFESPLKALFPENESLREWLNSGSQKIHEDLIEKYDPDFLVREIENAFIWQTENKSRQAGGFMKTWIENSKAPVLKNGLSKIEAELDAFFKEHTGKAV